jgi:hypothetical protein
MKNYHLGTILHEGDVEYDGNSLDGPRSIHFYGRRDEQVAGESALESRQKI